MTADVAGVRFSGGAGPEEIAAVLALLTTRHDGAAPLDGYERWRATRLKALRHKGVRSREQV
jgi:hypothetical protein